MRTVKDVEAYLLRLNRRFRALDDRPETYLLETGPHTPPVALRVDPPLVVIRVNVAAANENLALYRTLLELNAKSLVHSSYGLEGDRIVLGSALELENLDFNELQAALDEIDVALAQQVPQLTELTKADASDAKRAKAP